MVLKRGGYNALHSPQKARQPLLDFCNENGGTPSPGELLETILHVIIGHYNLFDKGILHRDISSGNILRRSEPVWHPALDKFECTSNVNYSRGFLIDGDHAIKWREGLTDGLFQ